MTKYSASAKVTKAALIRIQRMRGQMRSEVGMLLVALLFRLIIIRRRVSRRPSLRMQVRTKKNWVKEKNLPGTASALTAKLTQLTITMREQGRK